MHSAHAAPRCAARCKRSGLPCRAPAVRGWAVCRMHGARGGAPTGRRNGAWRHGGRTREMEELRALVAEMGRWDRRLAEALDPSG